MTADRDHRPDDAVTSRRVTSRRGALKVGAGATVAGVAVWTAPVILSGTAAAGVPSGLALGPNIIIDPGFDLP